MEYRKYFSSLGWGLFAFMAITLGLSFYITVVMAISGVSMYTIGFWFMTAIFPEYVCALPIAVFIFKKHGSSPPERKEITGNDFFIWLLIAFLFTYVGNWIVRLIYAAFPSAGFIPVNLISSDADILRYCVTILGAPIIEELIFRKILIDRTIQFSSRFAIIFSAVAFALFHGNIFQIPYAFLTGIIMGLFYVRFGSYWHCVLIHAILNIWGSASLFINPVYLLIINSIAAVFGLIVFIKQLNPFFFTFGDEKNYNKQIGLSMISAGTVAFTALSVFMIVLTSVVPKVYY